MKCKCGCGKEVPEKPWHKYYRHDFLKGHRPSKKLICTRCSYCGKTFIKRINKSTDNHFCSRECCGKFKIKKNMKTCSQCGNRFHRRGNRVGKNGDVFCSQQCTRIFFSGINHPHHNGVVNKICPFCKNTFSVASWNKNKIFCSEDCYWQSMVININNRKHKIYSLKQWKFLVKEIIKRDNGQCSACKNKFDLTVHHKEPYRINQDNSQSNLITLCRSCHLKADKLYRKLEMQRNHGG